MADVIRLDKCLLDLIREYKEVELADRQKDLADLNSQLSDWDKRDKYIESCVDMIDSWSNKDEKGIIQYALISAINEIKRRNSWQ